MAARHLETGRITQVVNRFILGMAPAFKERQGCNGAKRFSFAN